MVRTVALRKTRRSAILKYFTLEVAIASIVLPAAAHAIVYTVQRLSEKKL